VNDVGAGHQAGRIHCLVHIGHIEYSYYKPRFKTLFIPAYYLRDISSRAIEQAIEILKSRGARKIALYSTIQHARNVEKVAQYLSKEFHITNMSAISSDPKNIALVGCDYMKPYSIRDHVDAYVFIAGGLFHPLGLGYTIPFKPLIKIDPYEDRAQDLTDLIESKIKKRLYKMYEATEASNWALIDGVKGQNRIWFR
jgi:diphthamide biosynthesis enzyme Dph1/Dph2-like protein